MKSFVRRISIALLVTALTSVAAIAQDMGQGGTQARSSVTGTYEIALNFVSMKQAALARDIRSTSRCINNAREHLRDIQGNINRVAQTDLLNCQRRMQQLLRDQAEMTRQFKRVSADADAAGEFAQQRLKGAR